MRTFFVRVVRKFGSDNVVLGTAAEPSRRRGVGEGPRRDRGGAGRTQDRAAHHLVRVGSGKADHVASPCRERRAGISRRPHYRSPARLPVRHPRAFWCGVREQAGLPGLRMHDGRHTRASQGIMNGIGLPTVGRILGHRRLATAAIHARLDDAAPHAAAEKAARINAASTVNQGDSQGPNRLS